MVFATDPDGQLFYRRLDAIDPVPIPGTENAWYPFFSPDGEWVAYFDQTESVLKKVNLDGSELQSLASVPGVGQDAAWGPDGTIVVEENNSSGLWTVPDAGGDLEPIANTEGPALHWMTLLPDGNTVLAHQLSNGVRTIVAVSLETGERRALLGGSTPRYVPSGHLLFWRLDGLYAVAFDEGSASVVGEPTRILSNIAAAETIGLAPFAVGGDVLFYQAGGEILPSLMLVDRKGEEEPLAFEPGNYWYPRVSPDGGRIAVASLDADLGETDLWVLDLARSTRTRITFGGQNRFYPVWSPEGDYVVVSDGTANPNRIQAVAADGSGRIVPVLDREGLQYPTSSSRDGRFLAFHENNPESQRDVWVLPTNGEPELLVRTPAQDRGAAFSPDGGWIAYVSDKSGQDEVYVLRYPGPGAEVTISVGGGTEPVWSRDGSELFYRSPTEVMSVAANLDEGVFEAPQPLFGDIWFRDTQGATGIPFYDVMPDGKRFVMERAVNAFGSGVVILNLTQELNRLVPTN